MVDWEVIFAIFVRVNGFNPVIAVDKIFPFALSEPCWWYKIFVSDKTRTLKESNALNVHIFVDL